MGNVFDEVRRWVKAPVIEALDGEASSYDVDAEWSPHYMGHPRSDRKGAFGDDELIGAARAFSYLAMMLPVGAPRRRALVDFHRKVSQRLANPKLLLFGGFDAKTVPKSDALVFEHNYLYLRPTNLRAASDLAFCESVTQASWPSAPYPWSSTFPALRAWTGFGPILERLAKTPVPNGRFEIDPRASVPDVVERMRQLHDLDEDAATLYLQFLTLADAADAVLIEVNDWKLARYKAANAALVGKGLLLEQKMPRATRKCVLPGTWETLKPPNPALETWKLPLYDAKMQGEHVLAPLGRILPLRPIHVLFEEAFQRHEAEAPSKRGKPAAKQTRDWLREIAANPDDDSLRLVYADWLTEHGDPRGEFISLQIANDPKHAPQTEALLAQHRDAWTEAIHPFVKDAKFERGFVVGVTARPLLFVKNAKAIFAACPFLRELVIDAGPVGPVMTTHWRALTGCAELQRLTHLDLTADHYVGSRDDLELLLGAIPRLRWWRLGYHRTNEGFGLRGATLIAQCERLLDLKFLELPGLQIGIKSVRTLLESKLQLETLRLPYNGITDAQAKALADDLEKGLAPTLRTLDFSNVIATDFVTQAVDRYARNQVSQDTAATLASVLAARVTSSP